MVGERYRRQSGICSLCWQRRAVLLVCASIVRPQERRLSAPVARSTDLRENDEKLSPILGWQRGQVPTDDLPAASGDLSVDHGICCCSLISSRVHLLLTYSLSRTLILILLRIFSHLTIRCHCQLDTGFRLRVLINFAMASCTHTPRHHV